MVKLVDTLDLGSSASRRGGSSPFTRTLKTSEISEVFCFIKHLLTAQNGLPTGNKCALQKLFPKDKLF